MPNNDLVALRECGIPVNIQTKRPVHTNKQGAGLQQQPHM